MVNILKELFDKFLLEVEEGSIDRFDNKEKISLNSEVFEFQAHVAQRLKSQDINLLLDPVIHSEGIKRSFDKELHPFSASDYCLSFFDFLNVHRFDKLELYQLIDSFVEVHKEELNWQDIVITATGATRCRTNLRFALDRLRRIGLIERVNQEGRRVLLPTPRGELVFFCWRNHIKRDCFGTPTFNAPIQYMTCQ